MWKYLILHAPLAQLVEHMTLNHQVAGSSPAGCTRKCENEKIRTWFLLQISTARNCTNLAPSYDKYSDSKNFQPNLFLKN